MARPKKRKLPDPNKLAERIEAAQELVDQGHGTFGRWFSPRREDTDPKARRERQESRAKGGTASLEVQEEAVIAAEKALDRALRGEPVKYAEMAKAYVPTVSNPDRPNDTFRPLSGDLLKYLVSDDYRALHEDRDGSRAALFKGFLATVEAIEQKLGKALSDHQRGVVFKTLLGVRVKIPNSELELAAVGREFEYVIRDLMRHAEKDDRRTSETRRETVSPYTGEMVENMTANERHHYDEMAREDNQAGLLSGSEANPYVLGAQPKFHLTDEQKLAKAAERKKLKKDGTIAIKRRAK